MRGMCKSYKSLSSFELTTFLDFNFSSCIYIPRGLISSFSAKQRLWVHFIPVVLLLPTNWYIHLSCSVKCKKSELRFYRYPWYLTSSVSNWVMWFKRIFGLFLLDVTVDITRSLEFSRAFVDKSTALEMNVWNYSQNITDMRFL